MAGKVAQVLDELMGKDRNLAPEKQTQFHWSDPEMCKFFLAGFCPNQLFLNTKSDIGPCPKRHDEEQRLVYRSSSKYKRMGYEWMFLEELEHIVNSCNKRIRRNQTRVSSEKRKRERELEEVKPENEKIVGATDSYAIAITEIDGRLERAQQEVLLAARAGEMSEALRLHAIADGIKKERLDYQRQYGPRGPTLEVCDICGSLIGSKETDDKLNDHLEGKQHMGYAKIRAKLDDLRRQAREGKIRRGVF